MKRRLLLAGSVLLGAGFLAFIINWVGGAKVWSALAHLGLTGFLVLFADVTLTIACWLFSWVILLRAYGVQAGWGMLVRARLASYAVSYITPVPYAGGDPVGIYLLAKESSESVEKLVAAVIVARFLEGVTLLFFLTFGSLYALFGSPVSNAIYWPLLTTDLLFIIALGLGALDFWSNRLWATRLTGWLTRHLPWRPFRDSTVARVRRVEEEIHQAFHRYRRATAGSALVALLGAAFLYLRPQVFFYFSEQMVFSFAQLALIFALTLVLGTVFWITPGGLGVYEGGLIGTFALFGISADRAVAFSLALKPLEIFFVVLGFGCLLRFGAHQLWHTWAGEAQLAQASARGDQTHQSGQQAKAQADQQSR